MSSEILKRLEIELADWRAKLDEVRVQANLGTKELRDRGAELKGRFRDTYARARSELGALRAEGGQRADALRAGLEAGWDELWRTYGDALDKKRKGP